MGADTTTARARMVAASISELLAGKRSGEQLRRKLSTLVSNGGYERASRSFLDALTAEFAAAGIYSDYAPNDAGLTPTSWLRLALTPFPPTPLLFASEKDLETFIEHSLGSPGPFANLDLVERQYRIGGHVIDILAKERTRRGGKRHLLSSR